MARLPRRYLGPRTGRAAGGQTSKAQQSVSVYPDHGFRVRGSTYVVLVLCDLLGVSIRLVIRYRRVGARNARLV